MKTIVYSFSRTDILVAPRCALDQGSGDGMSSTGTTLQALVKQIRNILGPMLLQIARADPRRSRRLHLSVFGPL